MHERHDALIGTGYDLVRYAELPHAYQLALAHYKALDGEAWDEVEGGEPLHFTPPDGFETMSEDVRRKVREDHRARSKAAQRQWLEESLPEFVEAYGDEVFGIAILGADAARTHVMSASELERDWKGDWDAYHGWYASHADIPDHGRTERWPCIMSGFDYEAFEDGWHRFHSYCRAGDETIPVVFHPEERHYVAKGMTPPGNDGADGPSPGLR